MSTNATHPAGNPSKWSGVLRIGSGPHGDDYLSRKAAECATVRA